MISGISSGMSMPPSSLSSEQSLTEAQQTLISETLSELDADNLTEADALSIIEAFSQAGIQPSAALEKAMAEYGIDAKTVGELANVNKEGQRPPPPPPQQSTEEITSMVDYLTELLEEKLATTNNSALSDEDKQSILAQVFEKFDIEEGDSIINTTA